MTEITNPDPMDRIAENLALIAGAINTLAAAVNKEYGGKPIGSQPASAPPTATPVATGKPRGRKPADTATTTPAAAAAVPEADPFETTAAPAVTATIEEVREALTALKGKTDQATALAVLKEVGGAANLPELKAEKYGAVVAAAKAKAAVAAPAEEADPFEVGTAAPAKAATLEDVKAAVVAGQKRTATDIVQKVIMDHGGKAVNPATSAEGPSLKALSADQYAKVIVAINALPTTKTA